MQFSLRLPVLGFVVLLFMSQTSPAFAYTLEITEAQLQQQVEKMMPLTRQHYFVTVTLRHPRVDLSLGNNRLGISSRISARIPGVIQGTGNATISGKIRYDNQLGAFYLDQPRVETLHIDKLPRQYQSQIKDIAQQALADTLVAKPIYRLNQQDLRQRLAKSMLKGITINQQTLLIELDTF